MIYTRHLKFLFIFLLFLIGFSYLNNAKAQYQSESTELGVILGEPTGVSIQVWQSGSRAIGGALAWSMGGDDRIHLHADYLKHDQLGVDQGSLTFFYGLGLRTILSEDAQFGPRFPIGLHYVIPNNRFSLFFEVAPIFDLVPATAFDVNGGIGVRYFL